MRVYHNFIDLAAAPKEVYDYFIEMESHEPPIANFMDYYGGDVHVIERLEDLKEIPTTIEAKGENRWLSILETPDAFDACRYIKDANGLYQDWVEVYLATTDAGGATYFIPKAIADECPNVLKSIELSNDTWGEPKGAHITP